ncbi:MAG: hypothetical protein K6G39_07435 [Bacteroidales bacterium]|nr:hypothetical protein [Bacteroidales bacterium]
MKKIFSLLAAAAVLFACAPEQINHPTEDMVASAASYEPVINVDQTTNQVTFSLPQGTKGVIPVWEFPDKNGDFTQYAAKDGLTRIYTTMGDYPVRLQIMNAAGLSPDYVEKTFHIDNTIVNYDKYFTFFAGNGSKEWRLKGEVDQHFGCGEPGTTGTNWWAAKAWEKESTGIYEDRMTFTTEGAYTYNPGPDGQTYVNKDVTKAPGHAGEAEDYTADFPLTNTTFSFSVEGDDLFVTLGEAAFAYFPNDDFIANPRFKVESANTKTLELVNDNGSIAWHFTLSCEEPDNSGKPFDGFKYNAESNLWLPADANHTYSQYYAPGWSQLPNPDISYDGGTYSFTCPSATSDQWQNQFFIIPVNDISLSSALNYDFSVKVSLSQDVKGVTFKLTDATDDGNFLFTERMDIKAFEETVFWLSDVPGIDAAAVKMVFDFGGNPDNTEVTISHIVLKDHAVDDGTVLPNPDGPDNPDTPGNYTYGPNLWDGSAELETWFSPADWSGGLDPQASYSGGVLTLTTPEGIGGSEWMGQVKLHSGIAIDPAKQYSFSCKVTSGASGTITIKGTSNDDPGGREFFYDNGVALEAYEEFPYVNEPVTMEIDPADANPTVMLVFDFGRIPAGTEITVSDIVFREITGEGGGSSSHGDNLWDGSANLETWFSPGDWSGGLDPQASYTGDVLTLTTPEGIGGSEWMGQVKLHSGIAIDPAKQYAFSCKVNSSIGGTITIKGTSNDDPGGREFFYDNGVVLEAYEDLAYSKEPISMEIDAADANPTVMLVFDFGRIPAGAEISVSDIVFCEVVSGGGASAGTQVWDWNGGTLETWFSPASWSGGLDPNASFDGSTLTLTTPEGIGGSEWMGQVKLHTAIPADPSATYDFACVINSEADGPCTVKMTDNSDPGGREFFYDNGVSLAAYEDVSFSKTGVSMDVADDAEPTIMIVFDFGRIPAGTPITVSGISLIKH